MRVMKRSAVISACIVLLVLGCAVSAFTAFPIPGMSLPVPTLVLDKVFKETPPVTTSFEDCLWQVPYLDAYNPTKFAPLTELERRPNGFVLQPGLYEFKSQSYCLKAGTHGPSKGTGYLYAPLKGPKAEIVNSILANSLLHPEIPQEDVQVLLWAIIARTDFSKLPPDIQTTANRLLSPAQIKQLNQGALALLPDQLTGQAFARLPQPLQRVYQAEAELRQRLTLETPPTYAALERIAVLPGEPAPEKGPRIPGGRWSYHPDGYYIRYLPDGYRRMVIQVDVPEVYTIERDTLKRITLIADPHGNRIETTYDDTIAPLTIPGDPGIKGYAFKSIVFIRQEPGATTVQRAEWKDTGWTFVGIANGKGKLPKPALRAITIPRGVNAFTGSAILAGPARQAAAMSLDEFTDRFETAHERYENVKNTAERIQQFKETRERRNRPRSAQDIQDLTDLEHYNDGMGTVQTGDATDRAIWIGDHLVRVVNAWEYVNSILSGGTTHNAGTGSPGSGRSLPIFNPAGGVAVPANTGSQRLIGSGRSF